MHDDSPSHTFCALTGGLTFKDSSDSPRPERAASGFSLRAAWDSRYDMMNEYGSGRIASSRPQTPTSFSSASPGFFATGLTAALRPLFSRDGARNDEDEEFDQQQHQHQQRGRSDSLGGSFREFFRRGSQELAHAAESIVAPKRDLIVKENAQLEREFHARLRSEGADRSRLPPPPLPPPPKSKRATAADRQRALEADAARRHAHAAEREARGAVFARRAPARPTPPPCSKGLTSGEDLAVLISRAVDAFKKPRKDSGGFLTCLDVAPAVSDEYAFCDWCRTLAVWAPETASPLEHGLCPSEHEYSTEQPKFADLDRQLSRSSSPAKSRHADGDGYIKIAGSHKMRRMRQTVYGDPGNPFELEETDNEHSKMLRRSNGTSPAFADSSGFNPELRRSALNSSSPVAETDSSEFNFELGNNPRHSPAPSNYSSADSVLHRRGSPDVGMERFSGKVELPLHAPRARRPGTPALVRAHSLKEALIGVSGSPPPEDGDVYIPPRSLWRRSLPLNNLPEANGYVSDVRRDTKFYGFYDGVLEEYRAELANQI